MTGTGGDFETRKADWIKVAKNGHELANHTKNHVNVPADPSAASIISEMATYLRALDPGVQSLTFAYPNCNVNGKTGVGSENFIARGCGGTHYAWGTQPADWMNIEGLILTPTSVASGISAINSAKSGNTWAVTIVHDVKENPDSYSLTPADNLKMLQAGVASGAWIDTYQNIGAYYRAHFTMDTVTAASTSEGWKMAWTSPYAKLPKSVTLRVKLAAATFGTSFTVQQNGVTLTPEADGAYLIDFMKLSLTVLKQTTGVKSGAILPSRLIARAARDGIAFEGVIGEAEALVADVRGNRVFQGKVSHGLVPLPMDRLHGILFLTLVDRATGASIRAVVPN